MKIFISYRRSETRTIVGRMYDRLAPEFGDNNVFRDIDMIPPGIDFREVLNYSINDCDIMLVVIGEHWLRATDERGLRRIDDPSDFVHIEIAKGLNTRHIDVIPILIPPAAMPDADDLPFPLAQLAYQQAWTIGEDPYFHKDMDGLIKHLREFQLYKPVDLSAPEQTRVDKQKRIPRFESKRTILTCIRIITSIIVLMVAISGGMVAYYLANRPEPIAVVNSLTVIETPTATIEQIVVTATDLPATATDTTSPPTPVPTNTVSPVLQAAMNGVTGNSAWQQYSPYIQNFNGVAMVLVPAGCFTMGSNSGTGEEQPAHTVCFQNPYWIDRYEVTIQQFTANGGQALNTGGWTNPDQPRTDVTWFEAVRYCNSRTARLPSEAEWEYAARGVDSLNFPWGNTFIYEFAHVPEYNGQPSPVGSRPQNASWVGALDMSGNVWEWTNTIYDGFSYPYQLDARESYNPNETLQHVIRGGSFNESNPQDEHFQRASKRTASPANYLSFNVGIRCVRDL